VRHPHNFLRITRILKSLGEMGLEEYKIAFLEHLQREIYTTKALAPCRNSYANFWIQTIYDDDVRADFEAMAAGVEGSDL
jgi:hypothetical protein